MKTFSLLFLFLLILPHWLWADPVIFTVDINGNGDFTSIQAAIDATKAFPDEPITLFIKDGIYNEKVRVYAWNTKLTLQGESTQGTIITWGDYFDKMQLGRNSTFHTYTLKVEANDFTASNLTVINSAGPRGQAVALHVEGDRCRFLDCRFLGHQDTVYLAGENNRHYFKDCHIEGTTDFIFGEATAVFHQVRVHSKSDSYITAASTPRDVQHGFVFIHCRLSADAHVSSVYLGRPWRDFAKVTFIECQMDQHIHPEGWANWEGTQRHNTACFAEYQNNGPGADPSQRVHWARILSEQEARDHTILNILGGWNPQ